MNESYSKIFNRAIQEINSLPSVGRRTAVRLALHLIKQPTKNVEYFVQSILDLHQKLQSCGVCGNLSDTPTCAICESPVRNQKLVCVVEDIRDIMAIESTNQFNGVYHVLNGKISPLDGVSPEDLNIDSLLHRVEQEHIEEIFFALSQTTEGDTTAHYISRQLNSHSLKLSTVARGISVGYELEHTDANTLARSIVNRVPFDAEKY